MDNPRYLRLLTLLKKHRLTMTDVAREANCGAPNVRQFMVGLHNSLRVGRAIARLTGAYTTVSRATGLPVVDLKLNHKRPEAGGKGSRSNVL